MNRVGKALSPQVVKRHGSLGATTLPGESPDPALIVCITDTTTATYPRAVLLNASFTGLADAGAVAYRVYWVYSDDNGTTWQVLQDGNPPVNHQFPASIVGGQPVVRRRLDLRGRTTSTRTCRSSSRSRSVATTCSPAPPATSPQTRCQLTATLFNANGTTSRRTDAASGPETRRPGCPGLRALSCRLTNPATRAPPSRARRRAAPSRRPACRQRRPRRASSPRRSCLCRTA